MARKGTTVAGVLSESWLNGLELDSEPQLDWLRTLLWAGAFSRIRAVKVGT